MTSTRHRWPDSGRVEFYLKTERQCPRCGMVRVTKHDNPHSRPWTEWWRDAEQIKSDATPPCDARLEAAINQGGACS